MTTSGFQFSPQHAALHLILLEAACIKAQRPLSADRKSLSTLSNSFDNCGVPIWSLAVLPLACEIYFFGALYNANAIIGLS